MIKFFASCLLLIVGFMLASCEAPGRLSDISVGDTFYTHDGVTTITIISINCRPRGIKFCIIQGMYSTGIVFVGQENEFNMLIGDKVN